MVIVFRTLKSHKLSNGTCQHFYTVLKHVASLMTIQDVPKQMTDFQIEVVLELFGLENHFLVFLES